MGDVARCFLGKAQFPLDDDAFLHKVNLCVQAVLGGNALPDLRARNLSFCTPVTQSILKESTAGQQWIRHLLVQNRCY